MLEHSEQINELAAALVKAQAAFVAVAKAKTATVEMKNGGKYSYKYSDLADAWDVARKPLSDNGLSVIQSPAQLERGVCSVTTMLLHASGQWVKSTLSLDARDATPQSIGSVITYARRYGLASMIGLVTDDDTDAQEHAGGREQRPAQAQQPAQRQNGKAPAPAANEREQLVEALRAAYAEAKKAGADVSPPSRDEVAGWSDEMVRQTIGVFRAAKLEAEQAVSGASK